MRLLHFLAFLVVCIGFGSGEVLNVAIGQLFEFGLTKDELSSKLLPKWMGFDKDESLIFGVPRWENFENVSLTTKNGLQVEVNTKAELEPCGEQDYVFVEVYEDKDLKSFDASTLRKKIKEFAEIYQIEPKEVRAFSASDLEKYRHVTQNGISLEFVARPEQLVLWIRLGCGDFYEKAETEIYETAAEQHGLGKQLRLGQGQVLKDNVLALQTATPYSASRTTREIPDYKPVLYNKINTIKCKRAILCQKWLPFNTFTDEDGNLIKLRPKVFSSGDHPAFLNISYEKNTIAVEGIALETGTFGFRLEVRDHLNQVADAPFNVEVEDTPQANHLYQMHMNSRLQKFKDQPALLTLFVRRLIAFVGSSQPTDIMVDGIEASPTDPSNSILSWSNHSLARKTCQERQINETHAKMVNAKGRVLHNFIKAMGAEFHLSNIDVLLRDTCTPGASTIQIFNVRASTQRTPGSASAQGEDSGLSTGLLIALIAIAALLLLAIFVLIFFCLQRRRPAYKLKKKTSADYATKGHPVVFPDEMPPHEDETNGSTAAVTTPMLVNHEHPPLNPPQTSTTLHENPLYKPPSDSVGSPQRVTAGRLPPPYVAP